jgi:WXG100 family type VII secretion target
MAGGVDDFAIDTGELDSVIGDLEDCERELEQLLADLSKQTDALHETWQGEAAAAHRVAHDEWSAGMRAMRQAVVELRAAARQAHGNYTRAADANTSMWERMR